jgi:DNA-binding response OmpR family regulator
MRILFVDDYPGLVELYDLALAARGIEVVGAATAGQAITIAAAADLPFDAAVVDVQLPDGWGPELVERLHQLPALRRAPIIGISSFEVSMAGPFDAFVTKPCNPRALAALVRRLLAAADGDEQQEIAGV